RRKRHHNIASKVRSVQPVSRDKDGNYEMPVQVGILTVLCLGSIVWDRDAYHNERYIWPAGYTVQREYYSMKDPDKSVIYTCWITDGGDAPLFHVEAEDMTGEPIVSPTATGAWTSVLRTVNQIRHREHSNSASGPDYFGFSHPTIAKMIQDLPGADRCRSYIMQRFVE
ncbi:F/Y rich C-terminus-domain-containing protein, partial [Coemansia spiralis]